MKMQIQMGKTYEAVRVQFCVGDKIVCDATLTHAEALKLGDELTGLVNNGAKFASIIPLHKGAIAN